MVAIIVLTIIVYGEYIEGMLKMEMSFLLLVHVQVVLPLMLKGLHMLIILWKEMFYFVQIVETVLWMEGRA